MKTLILLIGIFVVYGEFFGNVCCDDLKVSETDVDSFRPGRSRRETQRNVDAMNKALRSTYPLDWPAATSCVTGQQDKRNRITQGNYIFDEYVALTCTLAVFRGGSLARFFPPNTPVPDARASLQTYHLPLHQRNSASFTTLPRTSIATFFTTAQLSGCDMFIASANNELCPLVAIHTNDCQGSSTQDVDNDRAIVVLNEVNNRCHGGNYQIVLRLASIYHQRVIIRQHYDYKVWYYDYNNLNGPYIFYGYQPQNQRMWSFCYRSRNTDRGECHQV